LGNVSILNADKMSEDKIDGKYFENVADFRYFGKKKQIQIVHLKKLTAD
jgi:hypothetical protein